MGRLKNYQLGFDFGGALLFFVIMIPNVIWFLVPARDDVMRLPSTTPRIDFWATMAQTFLVGTLCLLRSRRCSRTIRTKTLVVLLALVLLYFLGWCVYYAGHTAVIVILGLCFAPSLAFVIYAAERKNGIALVFAWLFLIFHGIHWFLNYIVPLL